jgi:predicted TIM-barrel fold metal-dependent hydrolase
VHNETICAYAAAANALPSSESPSPGPWLHPFVSLNPYVHTDLVGELDGLRDRWRVAGVKLTPPYQHYYPADARMYPLYARCQDLGLPILFHTGLSTFKGTRLKYADPLLLDDVAVDFPTLRIVLAHSGRGVWYEQAALLARLHEHVYLELAGLPPKNLATYFPDLPRLAPKMIFGSDWPVVPDLAANVDSLIQVFAGQAGDVLYDTGRRLLPL